MPPTGEKPRILCVDDEPHILEGLTLHLRRLYDVVTAASGKAGLDLIAQQGPFTVVLSDMRMPGMDGAAFLSRVRETAPDTTRMLLTGHADLQVAMMAVNQGHIFRFLTKPCPPDDLRLAFEAAVRHYRLVTAEKVLLEQTLHGAVKTLTDILALTSPIAFGRATRVRQHVCEMAAALNMENRWQVEVAAMLSQLGSVAIPEETIRKYYSGAELTAAERNMVARMPSVTEGLLANIPRLEPVREILTRHTAPPQPLRPHDKAAPPPLAIAADLLKIAVEYDELESRGISPQMALDTMRGRESAHDPATLAAFLRIKGSTVAAQVIREIPLRSLEIGMVLAEDMRAVNGLLLVTRGFEITQSFLEKIRNFREGYVNEPLRVLAAPAAPSKA